MLEARDRAAVIGLRRELAMAPFAQRTPLDDVVQQLTEVIGAEKMCAYRVRADDDIWTLDFVSDYGIRKKAKSTFFEDCSATIGALERFGFYNPARVEPAQRNQVLSLGSARRATEGDLPAVIDALPVSSAEKDRRFDGARHFTRFFERWDLDDDCQLRVLVCDGPALLGWVGGLRADPFDARATQVLRALVPALRRRLKLSARLGRLGAAVDPLTRAVLEHVAGAAFIVDARGAVVLANTAAQAMLARAPSDTVAMLKPPLRPMADVTVTSVDLASHGVGALRLVIVQEEALRADHAARLAARRHGLTSRETQVLAQLARGVSNLRIAHVLGCAERTVEVHVTRILLKMECATRAEAIARTLA